MSRIYDNWERLVAAVVKREEIWQLCHEESRSPSMSPESTESNPSSRSSDEVESSDQKPVSKLVFLGGSNPGFRLKTTLRGLQQLGKGDFGTTILTELSCDVDVSEQELLEKGTKMVAELLKEVRVTEDEFEHQMMVFGDYCRHENVAVPKAYYFSDKANGKLIVYDYYSQGSVFDMLHGKKHLASWESRLKVATGAARGIAHIHRQCGGEMAHGNIKSSNIFLNSEQYGRLSDFGLTSMIAAALPAKIYPSYQARKFRFKNVSQEGDVYRFGLLLLELLTGKSWMHADQDFGSDVSLIAWIRSIKYNEYSAKLFDPSLGYDEEDKLEMVEMLCIAMRCLEEYTICRPKMSDVLLMLDSLSRPYQIWSSWM